LLEPVSTAPLTSFSAASKHCASSGVTTVGVERGSNVSRVGALGQLDDEVALGHVLGDRDEVAEEDGHWKGLLWWFPGFLSGAYPLAQVPMRIENLEEVVRYRGQPVRKND